MIPSHEISRRRFVQLGTIAAGAALLPGQVMAAGAGSYTLPALPYAPAALEPHIDARTMEIHHGKHHAAYVAGLNAALEKAPGLSGKTLEQVLSSLPSVTDESVRTALRNHGGGHWNHALFWQLLAPAAQTGTPSEALARALAADFGSMDNFKKTFGEAAMKRFGSGWAWLILANGKLKITSTANQDNPLMKGLVPEAELGTPILGLDVWEHAYYLHYQNRRADYVSAWWSVVNWAEVSKRFAEATA
jgi:Fe-Mn family superoxide dismutase